MLTLLPIALLLTPGLAQAAGGEDSPSIARLFDARSAIPVGQMSEDPLVLLPLSRNYRDGYASSSREPAEPDASSVVDFLRGLDPAQWEYEKRSLDLAAGSHVRVQAPRALQDLVSRALVLLEDSVGRTTTVVVDLVSFGPNPGVSTLPPLIPAAEVARWTAIGTGHESYELTLRPGEAGLHRAERSVSFALDGSVSIAERAAGFVLYPERIAVGTEIRLALAPHKTGSWVAFALRNGRFLDTESMRAETLTHSITTEQGTTVREVQKQRHDPRFANHSLVVNAFLPEGKALAFVSSAGLESRVVFVRQVGAPEPTVIGLPEDLKRVASRNATVLARTDGINLPVASALATDGSSRLRSIEWLCSPDLDEPALLAHVSRHMLVEPMELLATADGEYELVELGAHVALMSATREPLDKALAKLAQHTPDPQSLAVTLTLRHGARDAATLARAVLPLRAGATSTVVLGRESVADLSLSAEVANSVAAADTSVGRLFDGITVSITPTATIGGGLTLDIDAHGRWSRGQPREHAANGEQSPRLQLPDADLLDVLRAITFAKTDSAPRKVTLGNAGTSSEALTLEVEVVDLR